jgi:hypothetical protein
MTVWLELLDIDRNCNIEFGYIWSWIVIIICWVIDIVRQYQTHSIDRNWQIDQWRRRSVEQHWLASIGVIAWIDHDDRLCRWWNNNNNSNNVVDYGQSMNWCINNEMIVADIVIELNTMKRQQSLWTTSCRLESTTVTAWRCNNCY